MSDSGAGTSARHGGVAWVQERGRIRLAAPEDAAQIATGVSELLVELGAKPAAQEELEAAALALIEDPGAGAVIVAECNDQIVGLLGVSWQTAIRVPGRYGLIQELWVHPDCRYRAIGADLLAALFDLARSQEVFRLEVGLPSERFPGVAATESFYDSNGFTGIGLRMRRLL